MRRALLLLALLSSTGCATQFTSIAPLDDGSFLVTRFRKKLIQHGELFHCAPEEDQFVCTRIDEMP